MDRQGRGSPRTRPPSRELDEPDIMDQAKNVALITGSATGIGRSVAWRLAELGFAIAVNYSRSAAEAEETAEGVRARGAPVIVEKANVSEDEAVREMVARTVEALGGLDVLVNNAAT